MWLEFTGLYAYLFHKHLEEFQKILGAQRKYLGVTHVEKIKHTLLNNIQDTQSCSATQ